MDPQIEQAEALFSQGKVDQARQCLQAVLEADASNAEALNDLGVICFQQGQLDQAADYFQQAHQADGEAFGPVVNLGGIAFTQGRYEDACRWYERALELDPENYNVMNELAVAYLERKQQKEAISRLRQSIRIRPDQPTVLSCLNKIETALGLEPTGGSAPSPQPRQPEDANQPRDIGISDLSGLALSPGPDVK